MPEKIYERENQCETSRLEYSDEELKRAWESEGQGHKQAVERDRKCCIVYCSETEAIDLTRQFVLKVFAIPTCCNFDGNSLSMYCGDAGSQWENTLDAANKLCVEKSLIASKCVG